MNTRVRISVVLCLLLGHGCASHPGDGPPQVANRDSAPREHFDASGIPDAVPRVEARSRYGNPESYVVFGQRYHVLPDATDFRERGDASWYGTKFHGRRTSSGEPYDMYAMTAAHKSLPLPSYVRVTNLRNNRNVVVRVNDRGPFHDGRIIDLSYAAALKLDVVSTGTAPVEIEVLNPQITKQAARVADTEPAATEPAPSTEARTTPPTGTLFIQLGAFTQADNALALKGKLEVADIRPVRIDEQPDDGLFRVRLGPFPGASAADDVALRLVALGITQFDIVNE